MRNLSHRAETAPLVGACSGMGSKRTVLLQVIIYVPSWTIWLLEKPDSQRKENPAFFSRCKVRFEFGESCGENERGRLVQYCNCLDFRQKMKSGWQVVRIDSRMSNSMGAHTKSNVARKDKKRIDSHLRLLSSCREQAVGKPYHMHEHRSTYHLFI